MEAPPLAFGAIRRWYESQEGCDRWTLGHQGQDLKFFFNMVRPALSLLLPLFQSSPATCSKHSGLHHLDG